MKVDIFTIREDGSGDQTDEIAGRINDAIKDKNIFMVAQSSAHGHEEGMVTTISVWYEEE